MKMNELKFKTYNNDPDDPEHEDYHTYLRTDPLRFHDGTYAAVFQKKDERNTYHFATYKTLRDLDRDENSIVDLQMDWSKPKHEADLFTIASMVALCTEITEEVSDAG